MKEVLGAIALMLIFESLLPLLSTDKWRRYIYQILQQNDRVIKRVALVMFLIGAGIWYITHHTNVLF